jgi:hypothetical protein
MQILHLRGARATLCSLASVALLAGAHSAQLHLQPGDVALAANGAVGVLDADGASSDAFLSAASVSTVLWDAAHPDELIAGGGGGSATSGFLVRQVFTAADQMTTVTLSPAGSFGAPLQISWDQTGENVIVVTSWDQVHRVHATTGVVTDLTSGAQPWGTSVTCGAMDPVSGDVFVGTSAGELWRLGSGGGPATPYASGLGSLAKVLFRSESAPHHLYFATTSGFGRVALGGTAAVEHYFGVLGTPSLSNVVSAAVDEHGDFVIGRSNSEVYRLPHVEAIPLDGVAPAYLGQVPFSSGSQYLRDVAVIGGTTTPFRLTVEAVPVLGASIAYENVPEPLGFGWMVVSAATYLPVDSGPLFGLVPDSLSMTLLSIAPSPGGPLAFTPPAPSGFAIPQLGMLPFFGQTWDCVAIAFSPGGQFLGRTNVERVTWQ